MIPRIDYDRIKARMSLKDWFAKRKKFKRPPQRLFDAEKIRSLGGDVASDGDFLIFEGNRYSRKGFLFKSFAMSAVITEGVKPTLSELEKFEDQPEGIDLEVVTESTGKEREHNLQPGDNVEVCEGSSSTCRARSSAWTATRSPSCPSTRTSRTCWSSRPRNSGNTSRWGTT